MSTNLGKLIVFEGPDNCGKTTQIKYLCTYLQSQNITFTTYKFPRYDSLYGNMIKYMLYNKDKFDIIHNLKDMNNFSYIQLQDKLDGINELYKLLRENQYVILDRYTLSSRIYDSSSRYLFYNESIKLEKFIDSNDEGLYYFLSNWVFSFDYRDNYYKQLFENGYSILEHPFFDIYHVIFKGCPELKRITQKERFLDNYESNTLFTKLVTWAYNNITKNTHHFFENNKYITVDTTYLTENNTPKELWYTEESIVSINKYIIDSLFNIIETRN
jgi:thymidylate kinase